MKLHQVLEEFGLSEREAKVYLAALELGEASVQEIAKKAGLERTGTYYLIEALIREGILNKIDKDRTLYIAAEPQVILDLAKRKKQLIEEHFSEFKALYNISDKKPKVRLYEGIEGIKTIFEKTLEKNEEILAFTSFAVGHDYVDEWGHEYVKRRAKKGISMRDIAEDSPESQDHKAHDKEEKRETRLVPKDKFPFTNEINILSDWVMIVSWKDMIGLVVESKDIATMWRSVFELAWLGAERVQA